MPSIRTTLAVVVSVAGFTAITPAARADVTVVPDSVLCLTNAGGRWIAGVLDSTEPAVLQLSEGSVIRTEMKVLLAGFQEGVLQKD